MPTANQNTELAAVPASYPKDQNGPVPLDANAALDWLETANDAELDWYYKLLLD